MESIFKKMFEAFQSHDHNAGLAIKNILTTAILSDKKLRGMALPSLSEMAHDLNISKSMASRAYKDLANMGLVVTQSGKLSRVVVILPSEQIEEADDATSNTGNGYGRAAYFNDVSPLTDDIPGLNKQMGNLCFVTAPHYTPEKKAELIKYILLKLQININNYVCAPFATDQLLVAKDYRLVLFNLVSTLVPSRAVIGVTERCSPTAYKALSLCKKEVITLGEDEHGVVTTDVEALCKQRKLGILYLNANGGQLRSNDTSAERLAHLIELSNKYEFTIVQDNQYENIDSAGTDPLMEAVYKENVRLIYLAPLTFVQPWLNDITIVCGAAADLKKIHAHMDGMYDMMPYTLAYSVFKLIQSGRLRQTEKLVKGALEKILPVATEEFLACGLWKPASVVQPKAWFFYLEPVSGVLPDNLYAELQKLRIYLIDAGHTISVLPVNQRLVVSIAAYLFNPHLVEDIRRLNEAIKTRLIYNK